MQPVPHQMEPPLDQLMDQLPNLKSQETILPPSTSKQATHKTTIKKYPSKSKRKKDPKVSLSPNSAKPFAKITIQRQTHE